MRLKPFGIKGDFYHVDAESRSCINIWDEVNHVQTEFLEPGFTLTEEDFARNLKRNSENWYKSADVVSMSGSCAERTGWNSIPEPGQDRERSRQTGNP